MVKSSLGIKSFLVLVMVMMSVVTMAPSLPILSPQSENTEDDSSTRIERSVNMSHITGTARKIRMLIRDKYLQIFADGTVNATNDGNSDYSIVQRSSPNPGQVKILGIATCAYLCMDSCGLLYSTRDFNDECVFYETTESNSFNSYSSVKYSNEKHIYYIGIKKSGIPRRVQIKADAKLGKFSECTRVLPQFVEPDIVDRLIKKLQTLHSNSQSQPTHNLRHHHFCPPPYHMKITESLKCTRKRAQKKKKEKGKCSEGENDECHSHSVVKTSPSDDTKKSDSHSHKKTKPEDTDVVETVPKKGKKRKSENKKGKHLKSPGKDSAEKNTDGDADDTMTTISPDDGVDD